MLISLNYFLNKLQFIITTINDDDFLNIHKNLIYKTWSRKNITAQDRSRRHKLLPQHPDHHGSEAFEQQGCSSQRDPACLAQYSALCCCCW